MHDFCDEKSLQILQVWSPEPYKKLYTIILMVTITKKGGGQPHVSWSPVRPSIFQPCHHRTLQSRFIERRNWNKMIHQKCSDFCCSNVLENSWYKHSQVDINLFQKERNLHQQILQQKSVPYLHVLDGSLFCVSSQEFGAEWWFWLSHQEANSTHGQFWTHRGHILNHRVPRRDEVTNPSRLFLGGGGTLEG